MTLLHCDNGKCLFCKRDYNDDLICTTTPFFMNGNKHTHESIMNCGAFIKRESSIIPRKTPNRDSTGLYPGQIGYKGDFKGELSEHHFKEDVPEECDT